MNTQKLTWISHAACRVMFIFLILIQSNIGTVMCITYTEMVTVTELPCSID